MYPLHQRVCQIIHLRRRGHHRAHRALFFPRALRKVTMRGAGLLAVDHHHLTPGFLTMLKNRTIWDHHILQICALAMVGEVLGLVGLEDAMVCGNPWLVNSTV